MAEEYLEAGRIINTFGVRGEVKVEPWCDDAAFLCRFKTLYLNGEPRRVLSARPHKGMALLLLEGVEDVNGAMALKNKVLCFRREDAALEEGRFFLSDIMGARVLDEEGREVGVLKEILSLPGQNVYVVQGEREHMIPAVPEFILDTDVENRLIRVHMIEGL